MKTLEDAWHWYEATYKGLALTGRLARKHLVNWDENSGLARDENFRRVDPRSLEIETERALSELDDLAVFVLFSHFEAEVRNWVLRATASERNSIRHPALLYWMRQAETSLEVGSFNRILESFKNPELHSLIEEVNQVRRYRNWVAHGLRDDPADYVSPRAANDRLRRFLVEITAPSNPLQ